MQHSFRPYAELEKMHFMDDDKCLSIANDELNELRSVQDDPQKLQEFIQVMTAKKLIYEIYRHRRLMSV